MMICPKIKSAEAIDNHWLLIFFDNQETRYYDVTPLLKLEMFQPLSEPSFFKNFQIDHGGYALVWNADIDISEYELWKNGVRSAPGFSVDGA